MWNSHLGIKRNKSGKHFTRGKGEIKYEGTLPEKFPALIRTQKKSKHNDFESVGLGNPELLLLENTVSVKEKATALAEAKH